MYLYQIRKEQDVTIDALAQDMGYSKSAIYSWERGYVAPSPPFPKIFYKIGLTPTHSVCNVCVCRNIRLSTLTRRGPLLRMTKPPD